MIILIDEKTHEIINEIEKQERESLERSKIQMSDIEHQMKVAEATIYIKTETLLQQSVSVELVQLEKSLDATVRGDEGERVDSAVGSFR